MMMIYLYPVNDCHARVSVNKIWLICYMFWDFQWPWSRLGKCYLEVLVGEYPVYVLRALCGIFMIVSIETGGRSHRSGIPELGVYKCECSYNLGCSAAADTKPRGLLADNLCPPVKGLCGPVAQQV